MYLGYFESNFTVIPPLRVSMAGILRVKLGVSDGLSKFLVRGGELNVMRLIEIFMQDGDPYDFVWQSRLLSALCMCLLAAYLLVSPDGRASHLLVGVTAQIEERRDVVPMVLAETLIGLDTGHAGQSRYYGGSPLLLQVGPHFVFLLLEFSPYFTSTLGLGFLGSFSLVFPLFGQMWLCDKIRVLRLSSAS